MHTILLWVFKDNLARKWFFKKLPSFEAKNSKDVSRKTSFSDLQLISMSIKGHKYISDLYNSRSKKQELWLQVTNKDMKFIYKSQLTSFASHKRITNLFVSCILVLWLDLLVTIVTFTFYCSENCKEVDKLRRVSNDKPISFGFDVEKKTVQSVLHKCP